MRLFSLTKEIAIDLGTANTIIIHNDKIVINEPSIVALDNRTDKLIAVGKEAHQMEGKGHPGIRTVRPLRKQKTTGSRPRSAWWWASHQALLKSRCAPYATPRSMQTVATST